MLYSNLEVSLLVSLEYFVKMKELLKPRKVTIVSHGSTILTQINRIVLLTIIIKNTMAIQAGHLI